MILGIDTATKIGALGLYSLERGVIGELNIHLERGHARMINQYLDFLFKEVRVKPEEIKGLAVGLGPGSFTGTRVGITVVRIWSLLYQIPIWGLSTLSTLALGLKEGPIILSAVDALRNRIYYQLAVNEADKLKILKKEDVASLEQVVALMKQKNKPFYLAGPLPTAYCDYLKQELSDLYLDNLVLKQTVRGGDVAYHGYLKSLSSTESDKITKIVPHYLSLKSNY